MSRGAKMVNPWDIGWYMLWSRYKAILIQIIKTNFKLQNFILSKLEPNQKYFDLNK
jgi:hypothetical protein